MKETLRKIVDWLGGRRQIEQYFFDTIDHLRKYIRVRTFIRDIIFSFDYLFSKVISKISRTPILLVNTITERKKNNYLCIFSHYDKDGLIDPYVIHYLKRITEIGCDIIFVTTSPNISNTELQKLHPFCIKTIVKRNTGRDFTSFQTGIQQANDIQQYDKLLLANDSVYGPFDSLKKLMEYGDNNTLDMWGATDSYEKKYHVQSYFLVLSNNVIKSDAFKHFWRDVTPLYIKNHIVLRYEIGFSQLLIKNGFKVGAYCNYWRIEQDLIDHHYNDSAYFQHLLGDWYKRLQPMYDNLQSNTEEKVALDLKYILKNPVNSSHTFWDLLIKKYNHLFVKKDLFMHDMNNISLQALQPLLKRYPDFDLNLITHHLKRMVPEIQASPVTKNS